jgi:hypothetical protein
VDDVTFALIKLLVSRCVIDADDITEIASGLSDDKAAEVRSAWLEAVASPEPEPVNRLRVVD